MLRKLLLASAGGILAAAGLYGFLIVADPFNLRGRDTTQVVVNGNVADELKMQDKARELAADQRMAGLLERLIRVLLQPEPTHQRTAEDHSSTDTTP
jgi:hypothetical protein